MRTAGDVLGGAAKIASVVVPPPYNAGIDILSKGAEFLGDLTGGFEGFGDMFSGWW